MPRYPTKPRSPGTAAAAARMRFQVKGSMLRGRVAALQSAHALEKIAPSLGAETRRLLEHPPLASGWIDGSRLTELDDVISDVLGEEALASIALESARQTVGPLLRNVTEGTLRLFGTSPVTLLSRMDTLSSSTVRGVSFVWRSEGDTGGTMTATYGESSNVPRSAFVSMRAGLLNVFDLCGGAGTVTLVEWGIGPTKNSSTLRCEW